MCAFVHTVFTALRHQSSPLLRPSCHPYKRARWLCSSAKASSSLPSVSLASLPGETIWDTVKRVPSEPGVYRFLNGSGSVLYVGKARRLRSRLRQYVARDQAAVSGVAPSASVGPRIAAMVAEARAVDFIVTRSESAALALEASLVAEHRPRYNVLLKDDRRHPYAMITFSELYPRIVVTRTRTRRNREDRLYGPFVDEGRLRQVLTCIHSVFPLRQRPRKLFPDRPCINYDLGRCPGVCQELISPEEYAKTIAKVDMLLTGRVEEVLHDLREEMNTLSASMEYERAAGCRDRIATLERAFYVDALPGEEQGQTGLQDFVQESEDAASIVVMDPFVSRDVFSIAHSESVGKVVLFQVRGGKVIARLVFSVVPHEGLSAPEDLLSAALTSHYAETNHPMEIPEEVVVSTPVTDSDMLKRALSEKRGKSVSIRLPGANTFSLARIVQHNADVELGLESQRASDILRDLNGLSKLLSPYFQHLVVKVNDEDVENIKMTPPSDDEVGRTAQSVDLVLEKPLLQLARIEGYDISHTSGSNAVGSMVVFLDGSPAPSEYRRYNLHHESSSQGHPDDFESIRETLRRRFKSFPIGSFSSALSSSSLPDLLIIDGGKGQLSAAVEALEEVGLKDVLAVISIAKGEEEIFVPSEAQSINYDEETQSWFMNDGIRLVCRIRDEAHRTAVRAHRKRRGRQVLKSGLDSIVGLGAVKRSVLLGFFNGSSEAIAKASEQELRKAPGIGPALARKIYDHFHAPKLGTLSADEECGSEPGGIGKAHELSDSATSTTGSRSKDLKADIAKPFVELESASPGVF